MDPDASPPDLFGVIIVLLVYGLPFLFFVVSGVVGVVIERRHFRSIREREAATASLPVINLRNPDPSRPIADARLVIASVVISHDNFKRFLAQVRKIFGGRMRSYESLLDRARREAILRLKAQCPGAHIVLNLRLDTANIANTQGKKGLGALEVVASGTAVRYAD